MKKRCFYFALPALAAFFAFLSACGEGNPVNLDDDADAWREIGLKIDEFVEHNTVTGGYTGSIMDCQKAGTISVNGTEVTCPDISIPLPPSSSSIPLPSSSSEEPVGPGESSSAGSNPSPSSTGGNTSSAGGNSSSSAGVSSSSTGNSSSSATASSSSAAGVSSSSRASSSSTASSSSRAASSSSAAPSSSSVPVVPPSSSSTGGGGSCNVSDYDSAWCGGKNINDVIKNQSTAPANAGDCVFYKDVTGAGVGGGGTLCINGSCKSEHQGWYNQVDFPAKKDGGFYVYCQAKVCATYINSVSGSPCK